MEIKRQNGMLDIGQSLLKASTIIDCDLSNSAITRTILSGAAMQEVDAREAKVDHSTFVRAHFQNVDFGGVVFERCSFDGAMIDGVAISDLLAAYKGTGDR